MASRKALPGGDSPRESAAPRSIRPRGLNGAGGRRGPTIVGRDRRAEAAWVMRYECQRVESPVSRGEARDAPRSAKWESRVGEPSGSFSAFPSRVVGRPTGAFPLSPTAGRGERPAIGRRTLLPTAVPCLVRGGGLSSEWNFRVRRLLPSGRRSNGVFKSSWAKAGTAANKAWYNRLGFTRWALWERCRRVARWAGGADHERAIITR